VADPAEERTAGWVAGSDGGAVFLSAGESAFVGIEAEPTLASGCIGAVAGEAVVGEDGKDVARESGGWVCRDGWDGPEEAGGHQGEPCAGGEPMADNGGHDDGREDGVEKRR
jgi:hypothetical protein